MQAIGCTDMVATMPVFRPLIGMDKTEIVSIAHRIEHSIYRLNHMKIAVRYLHQNIQEQNQFHLLWK